MVIESFVAVGKSKEGLGIIVLGGKVRSVGSVWIRGNWNMLRNSGN